MKFILYFIFPIIPFSIIKAQVINDSIIPKDLIIYNMGEYKGIKFDDNINEAASYIDSSGFLIVNDSSAFLRLKIEKEEIFVLSKFPNIYFQKNDSIYYIYNNEVVVYDESKSGWQEWGRDIRLKQFSFQFQNYKHPLLIIEWYEENLGTTLIHHINIIDFATYSCLFDEIDYSHTISYQGFPEVFFEKKIEIKKDGVFVNNPRANADKYGYDMNEFINNLTPGLYKFINGKFRLQN